MAATETSTVTNPSTDSAVKAFQQAFPRFDPKQHIDFTPPSNVYTMGDIKLPEGTGVSPVAVSEPFQFFTSEAVHRMRAEVLSNQVWKTSRYSSNLSGGKSQLRGFASK